MNQTSLQTREKWSLSSPHSAGLVTLSPLLSLLCVGGWGRKRLGSQAVPPSLFCRAGSWLELQNHVVDKGSRAGPPAPQARP